jgi:hypothetical protein
MANEHDWKGIAASTTGIVFMGTPHRGTGSITSQALLYRVIAAKMEVQESVLNSLTVGNEALNDVLSEFTRLVNAPAVRLQIICFFEQKPTTVGRIVGDATLKVSVKGLLKMIMLTIVGVCSGPRVCQLARA